MEERSQFVRAGRTSRDVIEHLPVVKALRLNRNLLQNIGAWTADPAGIGKAILEVHTPAFEQLCLAFGQITREALMQLTICACVFGRFSRCLVASLAARS